MATLYPQAPLTKAGNMYLNGMTLTWLSNTQMAVSQGSARDSTNTVDIVLARPPLNNGQAQTEPFILDNTIRGAGGVDIGSVAPDTSYAIYVIYSSAYSQISIPPSPEKYILSPPYLVPAGGSPVPQSERYLQANVLMSTNFVTPVLPAGFDSFRRIGAISTYEVSGIPSFITIYQSGFGTDRHVWFAPSQHAPAESGSTSWVTMGSLQPWLPVSARFVVMRASLTAATYAGDTLLVRAAGTVNLFHTVVSSQVAGTINADGVTYMPVCFNNGVPGLEYMTSDAGDTVDFGIFCYVDSL